MPSPDRRSAPAARGVFVAGTDTGVGKSVLAAAICAALAARGERVAAFKPVVTGLDEDPGEWGPDHELLASVATAGQSPEDVAPYRFGAPLSPHLASAQSGVDVDATALVNAARAGSASADCIVVEGVGGLIVPLTPTYTILDLAAELALPVLIAARTGLGTINHSMLSIEAARAAGLRVAGVVMTPWPADPEPIAVSNRDTVERLGGVRVSGLAPLRPRDLGASPPALPLTDWIA